MHLLCTDTRCYVLVKAVTAFCCRPTTGEASHSPAVTVLQGALVVNRRCPDRWICDCRLEHGADPLLQDADGETALHKAVQQVSSCFLYVFCFVCFLTAPQLALSCFFLGPADEAASLQENTKCGRLLARACPAAVHLRDRKGRSPADACSTLLEQGAE